VEQSAAAVAEQAAREAYGRLVALLASRSRDIAGAEDALSLAFVAALTQWPRDGVPQNPTAWLLTAAKRRLFDASRHDSTHAEVVEGLKHALDEVSADASHFPDERLKLLFVCAHPAIDPEARTPLMLQTVLGLDAARISSAFCVAPKTMGQRLWRAKTRIRDAGVAFEVPELKELPERVGFVLEAIYAAFGTSWDDVTPGTSASHELSLEAISLARLVVHLLPDRAEARGLLALMLFCDARRAARRDADGRFVPLTAQRADRWDQALLAEAEAVLLEASRLHQLGPFQLEAAIQSLHVARARLGRRDDALLVQLYDGLVQLAPSLGAHLARAAAIAEAHGPAAGLEALEQLDAASRRDHQPAWALKAELLARLGRGAEASHAFSTAAGLTEDPAVREYLLERARSAQASPPKALGDQREWPGLNARE